MSILLTSPAYLLAIPALAALRHEPARHRVRRSRSSSIAFVNLMHFSQGWVQFGYRFSNDFVPWALLLVALGMERVAGGRSAAGVRRRAHRAPRSRSTCGASSGATSSDGDRRPRRPRRRRRAARRARRRARSRVGVDRARRSCVWRLMPGRRLLGHRRVPDGPAGPGHGPPDRLPDVRPARLARRRSLLAPLGEPAFRMNLPVGDPRRRRPPALTVDLVRRLTGSTILGVAAGLGLGADADRLGDRHPRRPARAPPRLRRRCSCGCSSAGSRRATVEPTPGRDARPAGSSPRPSYRPVGRATTR